MGFYDIDRNITRQLWERFKNTFSRNDIIPVKNGGTGCGNRQSAVYNLAEDSNYIKAIKNSYVIPESGEVANIILHINTNSFFIDTGGEISNFKNESIYTKIAEFMLPDDFPNITARCVYNVRNSTFEIKNHVVSIYTNLYSDSPTPLHNVRGFISMPV